MFADLVLRTAYLIAMAVAPGAVTPDPWVEGMGPLHVALAAAALLLPPIGMALLARRIGSTIAKAAAIGLPVALVVAVVCTALASHDEPLARAVAPVALVTWIALALVGATTAEQVLGQSRFKQSRTAGSVLVLAGGLLLNKGQAERLKSPENLWTEALRAEPQHERALAALTREAFLTRDFETVARIAGKCLATSPTHCGCLTLASRAALERGAVSDAEATARSALEKCPEDPRGGVALAEALVKRGAGEEAIVVATAATGKNPNSGRAALALGLALHATGNAAGALEAAKRAIALGEARDGRVLAGALSILAGDLDGAKGFLEPAKAASPNDADVLYNLALVADKKGDFNGARQGYLAALKAKPSLADARYNLMLLTERFKIAAESKHHAQKFVQDFPKDPRAPGVAARLGGAGP